MKFDLKELLGYIEIFINYVSKIVSSKDHTEYDNVKVYLAAFVIVSFIFNVYSVYYMSNQASVIQELTTEVSVTKESLKCLNTRVQTAMDRLIESNSMPLLLMLLKECDITQNSHRKNNTPEGT